MKTVKSRSRFNRKMLPWLLAAIGGVGLAVVVVVLMMLAPSPVATAPQRAVLKIDWPENNRFQTGVYIDKTERKLPRMGPVEYVAPPGKHQVSLRMSGYEPVEFEWLAVAGKTMSSRPEWKEVPGLDRWDAQDLESANRLAAAQNKGLLILFEAPGTQSGEWLASEALVQHEFYHYARKHYVLTRLKVVAKDAPPVDIPEAGRNAMIAGRYGIEFVPTLLATDALGRAFGLQEGYRDGGAEALVRQLEDWQEVGKRLKTLFDDIDRATNPKDKIEVMQRAASTIRDLGLAKAYGGLFADWATYSREHAGDPGVFKVVKGITPQDWLERLRAAPRNPERVAELIKAFDDWKQSYEFRDKNVAAFLHLAAAIALAEAGDYAGAAQRCDEGLAYDITKPELREWLQHLRQLATSGDKRLRRSWGTGFLISGSGHILTNYHVVKNLSPLAVRFETREELIPATVVARDPVGDMALLKIDLPQGPASKTIRISRSGVKRGQGVCALGFPNIGEASSRLMQVRGLVSGLPNPPQEEMIVTDGKVNPGNSGGPLLNMQGEAMGMLTAKTLQSEAIDSFGLAISAEKLVEFLEKHLPDLPKNAPVLAPGKDFTYEQVSDMCSPAVVQILRASVPKPTGE